MKFKIIKTDAYAKWNVPLVNMIGKILLYIGLTFLIPTVVALYYGEDTRPFLYPAMLCILTSLPLVIFFYQSGDLRQTDGLFFVAVIWVILITIGSIPYIMTGFSIVDSVFEATSGFTTTGSTIFSDFDHPNSLFIWRALTHWVGGITIILIFMSLLPLLGIGGRSTFMNEVSGANRRNYSARVKDIVAQFVTIYAVLTVAMLIICLTLGVDVISSACLSMSTVSTGGFLNHDVLDYSAAVKVVMIVFMFMGGTNFYLHFRAIYKRDTSAYTKNTEFKMMLTWYISASFILFAMVCGTDFSFSGYADILFTVVSVGTTTGFMVIDLSSWPAVALFTIFVVMFIGGSSGSTSGGVKVFRAIIFVEYIKIAINRTIHPRAVFDTKIDNTSLSENAISSSVAVILVFLVSIVIGSIATMALGMDETHAITATVSQITNAGPAFILGTSFANISDPLKIFFSILMWVGRLEIILALVLISPVFWKEFLRGRSKSG